MGLLLQHDVSRGFGVILCTLLPTPRLSRGSGLVLDLLWEKISSCVFFGFFVCTCHYFGVSFKTGDFDVMCYIKATWSVRGFLFLLQNHVTGLYMLL